MGQVYLFSTDNSEVSIDSGAPLVTPLPFYAGADQSVSFPPPETHLLDLAVIHLY